MSQNNNEIKLFVSDEQLKDFKETVENCCGGQVTDPLLMLTNMLQNECLNTGAYADIVLDSGHNSVGDVIDDFSDFYIEYE